MAEPNDLKTNEASMCSCAHDSTPLIHVSVVIPVFNEEDYLGACLTQLLKQVCSFDEVLVVDNNSTDGSVALAQKFDVTLAHEGRQGQVYARALGFGLAKHEIIASLDADSVVSDDWLRRVKDFTSYEEQSLVAGAGWCYDMYLRGIQKKIFTWLALDMHRICFGTQMVWAANMVITKTLWRKISPDLQMNPDHWEDHGIALLAAQKTQVTRCRDLVVAVSARTMKKPLLSQINYLRDGIRTHWDYGYRFRAVVIFCAYLTLAFVYVPNKLAILAGQKRGRKFLSRMQDPEQSV